MKISYTAKRVLSVLFFLIGLAIFFAASMVAAFQAARVNPRTGFLVVVASLVFFLGVLLTTELAGKLS